MLEEVLDHGQLPATCGRIAKLGMPSAEDQGPVIGTISVSTSVSLSAVRRVTLPKRATKGGRSRAVESRGKAHGKTERRRTGRLCKAVYTGSLPVVAFIKRLQMGTLCSMPGSSCCGRGAASGCGGGRAKRRLCVEADMQGRLRSVWAVASVLVRTRVGGPGRAGGRGGSRRAHGSAPDPCRTRSPSRHGPAGQPRNLV